jgi:regulator of replication initiation timing
MLNASINLINHKLSTMKNKLIDLVNPNSKIRIEDIHIETMLAVIDSHDRTKGLKSIGCSRSIDKRDEITILTYQYNNLGTKDMAIISRKTNVFGDERDNSITLFTAFIQ